MERDLWALFFQNSFDPLCLAGFDGRLREVNPAWTRLLGWTRDELLARPWLDFVHPDDREATRAAGTQLAAGRPVVAFENRYRHRDGSWRWLSWNSMPLPERGLIVGAVRDITAMRQMHEALAESEARLRSVVNNSPMGMHLYELAEDDRTLTLIGANPAADRFTGTLTQPLVGLPIEQAFPQLVGTPIPDGYRALARGGPAFEMRDLPYEDGRIKGVFDVIAFPAGPRRMATFFTEVTERRRQEEEQRRSREDLRITLDSIGDAVIATDQHGVVTRMNPVAARLTGWTPEAAIGRPIQDVFRIVNAETGAAADNPVDTVLREGRVVGLANHTALIARDGVRRLIADSGAPIRAADGAVVGVVLVFRDVTEEEALQAQLLHAQKMDSIGKLAGGVAHDFNNLLGAIMGACELLSRRLPPGDARARSHLDTILATADRAADLTQKLLSFARKGKLATVPLDLHQTVHQVVGLIEHTVDRRIAVTLDLRAEPSTVLGDPSQIQNALLNLALNARDAMPGGGTLTIASAVRSLDAAQAATLGDDLPAGRYLALTMRDTGHGIPPEILPHIFEPFFTTKGPGKGTGLGLSAVYGAMRNHHGAVTVESTPGRGTCFTCLFPLVDGVIVDDNTESSRNLALGSGRILVVDDEASMRLLVGEMLSSLGYRVETAGTGAEAVATVRGNGPFDLVLLDLVMPEMSGADAFAALRREFPNLRILIASGHTPDSGGADDLLTGGAMGFLQKPYRFKELAQAVAQALAQPAP